MGLKKGKAKQRERERQPNADEQEEVLALSAIYGDEFLPQDDVHGFTLAVVPSPGR